MIPFMKHDTLINIPWELERAAPPFEGNDIKSPEGLFRYIFKKHTKKGDKIFDPFVGLGTSMFVAEEMGRIPFGIEAEEDKFEWTAGQLENWMHMICDDAYNAPKYDLPKMDLIMTCPPYMEGHTKWNPLYGGDPKHAGYDKYLKRMGAIFRKTLPLMKKNTPLIIQLDNINGEKHFTPLIHDIVNVLSKDFIQTGETHVKWGNPKPDYSYTTLLIFKKK
jgi:DNA modification methylase